MNRNIPKKHSLSDAFAFLILGIAFLLVGLSVTGDLLSSVQMQSLCLSLGGACLGLFTFRILIKLGGAPKADQDDPDSPLPRP